MTAKAHALIVDDEADIRELLTLTLGRMGIETCAAASLAQAKRLLAQHTFAVVLTDLRLPDGDGIELIEHIQAQQLQTPVAVITAYGSMDIAIRALKCGAFDFISKPIELSILRDLIKSALKLEHGQGHSSVVSPELLGESPAMQQLKKTLVKIARSQAPVYIFGESGTGKELIARQIHALGPRSDRPFVPVNCGAIPTELLESEFFGHRKGSFTGAIADKPGLFQAAHGGSLFLDEVADLPAHMQVKLLRAIQERAVKPIGAAQEIAVDARIISATHKDLAHEIQAGRFRQDLYYRLNVIELKAPPLRERLEDLPNLANHILARLASRGQIGRLTLSEAALSRLGQYPFPGNVRELENILERAATLCEGAHIRPEDLTLPQPAPSAAITPAPTPAPASGSPLDDALSDAERQAIVQALEKTRWNKTAAAKLLGLTFRQLRYRIKKLGLQ